MAQGRVTPTALKALLSSLSRSAAGIAAAFRLGAVSGILASRSVGGFQVSIRTKMPVNATAVMVRYNEDIMQNKFILSVAFALCIAGTAAFSENTGTQADSAEQLSFWSDPLGYTAENATSLWEVTKNGSVTAWQATKSGSSVVWEKVKSGTETACEYRPSNLAGSGATGAAATLGGATAAAGMAAKGAGFYTLTHAVTGATMLGSTAGGASAAGTVGIMGGTAGAVGTIGSVIMAPATIVTGLAVAGGTVVFESTCYFAIETLDDPKVILEVLASLALHSDPEYFELTTDSDGNAHIFVATEVDTDGRVMERTKYSVENLYIDGGVLKNRDWGPNSQVGNVGYILGELKEE